MSRINRSDVGGPGVARSLWVLKIDTSMLVLNQGDIRTIEGVGDVLRIDPPGGGVGWIEFEDRGWPVFSLAENLRPIAEVPEVRRLCAVLAGEGGLIGILCDEVQVLESEALRFIPLPACMRYPDSPVSDVAEHAGGVLCQTSAQALLALLTGASAEVTADGQRVEGA